jgi:hypothetical protein
MIYVLGPTKWVDLMGYCAFSPACYLSWILVVLRNHDYVYMGLSQDKMGHKNNTWEIAIDIGSEVSVRFLPAHSSQT